MLKELIGIIIAFIVLVSGLGYLAYKLDKKACYSQYGQYQPEYVGVTTGCMIIVDDQRIPAHNLRVNM